MIPFYSDKEDKDFRDVAGAMASAFNTLRFEPDKGLDTALQTIKQQRSARRAKNKTVEYLRGLGQPEATRLANMVETGQLTGQQAYSQIFALEQEKRAADRAAASAAQSKAAAELAFQRQLQLKEMGFANQKELARLQAELAAPKDGRTATMKEFELAQTNPDFAKFLSGNEETDLNLTAGEEVRDKEFVKTLEKGGDMQSLAAAQKDAAAIESVLAKLEAGESLSGAFQGNLPDWARTILVPESVDAQQLVEGVVQQNLRAILGGQFAQKEGEQLVKRAYNPALPPETNAARLRALLIQLKAAADNKLEKLEYFNKNGTLKGFEGSVSVPTYADFNEALNKSVGVSTGDAEIDALLNKYGG